MVYLVIVKRLYPVEYYRTSLIKMKGTRLMLKSDLRRIAAELGEKEQELKIFSAEIVKRLYPVEYYRTSLIKMKGTRLMLKSDLRRIAAEYFNVVEHFITVL